MTMHLLPVWVTTTNMKKSKRKNVTKKHLAALNKHNKFLKRMGIDSEKKVSAAKSNKKVTERETNYIPSSKNGIGNVSKKEESYKLEVSKQYTIAPAYNKGAYQVIGKNDIKNIGR